MRGLYGGGERGLQQLDERGVPFDLLVPEDLERGRLGTADEHHRLGERFHQLSLYRQQHLFRGLLFLQLELLLRRDLHQLPHEQPRKVNNRFGIYK